MVLGGRPPGRVGRRRISHSDAHRLASRQRRWASSTFAGKVSLDLLWLKDDRVEDAADLPTPEVIAQEMMEELEAALAEIAAIVEALGGEV